MSLERAYSAAAQFGDTGLWWVTGGYYLNSLSSTELYDSVTNRFSPYIDLPKALGYHNLVNINNTHMVLLGGSEDTNEAFMFNR